MEAEYFCVRSHNQYLVILRLIFIRSFLVVTTELSDVSLDAAVGHQAVKTPWTNIHVSFAKWNVTTMLRSIRMAFQLLIPLQAGWVLEKAGLQVICSKTGSYHSSRISLILLHTFAKWLIALTFSTSLGSRTAYCICIQLITAVGLDPHKTLLHRLADLWVSCFDQFVPYMNCGFSLDSNPAMSSWGKRTRARTKRWDMTAEPAVSCRSDEFKCPVDESVCLEENQQSVFSRNRSQDDVAGSR